MLCFIAYNKPIIREFLFNGFSQRGYLNLFIRPSAINYRTFADMAAIWETKINAAKKAMKERQPHGRLVAPDEIAAMAVYLASDESRSTIGSVMVVDGGMTAK